MQLKSVTHTIVAHAWNGDGSMLAISPNTSSVFIYERPTEVPRDENGNERKDVDLERLQEDPYNWKKVYELEEHHMLVTGIDWHGPSNRILTSGQDRNAYVWSLDEGENVWKPELVILRIGRAATCVRWSPDGQKFAAGSGSKQIPVCHYEDSQSFWVAKVVKKGIRSTIMSIDWSPNNLFLIAGGSDFKCRIFSGFIKGVDQETQEEPFASLFGASSFKFGSVLAEFDQAKGWVDTCRFSPSGVRFAFCGHDSSVHFGAINPDGIEVATILRRDLPVGAIDFLTDDLAIGGGYDNVPIRYRFNGGNGIWEEEGPLDEGRTEEKSQAITKKDQQEEKASEVMKRTAAWGKTKNSSNNLDKQKSKDQQVVDLPKTRHQNMINGVIATSPTTFTTCGIDGRVLYWDATRQY